MRSIQLEVKCIVICTDFLRNLYVETIINYKHNIVSQHNLLKVEIQSVFCSCHSQRYFPFTGGICKSTREGLLSLTF